MTFIFYGWLLGSIVTSQHDTREQCEGRAVLLREKGVTGECVKVGGNLITSGSGGNLIIPCSISGGCYRENRQ